MCISTLCIIVGNFCSEGLRAHRVANSTSPLNRTSFGIYPSILHGMKVSVHKIESCPTISVVKFVPSTVVLYGRRMHASKTDLLSKTFHVAVNCFPNLNDISCGSFNFSLCHRKYSDTSANEDNSFGNHVR